MEMNVPIKVTCVFHSVENAVDQNASIVARYFGGHPYERDEKNPIIASRFMDYEPYMCSGVSSTSSNLRCCEHLEKALNSLTTRERAEFVKEIEEVLDFLNAELQALCDGIIE